MYNKRAYEFSFSWIFAIIAGAIIIFIAIYASTRVVQTGDFEESSKRSVQISTLLNPLQTSIEEARYSYISVPEETKIFNKCFDSGNFGSQKLSISKKSRTNGDFSAEGEASTLYGKYLFSNPVSSAEKEYYVLSKPFNFPFKIADVIVFWGDEEEYCFVRAPEEIKEELNETLKLSKLEFKNNVEGCLAGSKKICFSSGDNCDKIISLSSKTLLDKERDKTVRFLYNRDNNVLLYSAIFSGPDMYECQIKRIGKRAVQLGEIYKAKSQFLQPKGCGSANLLGDINNYVNSMNQIGETGSDLLDDVEIISEELGGKNDFLNCKLF